MSPALPQPQPITGGWRLRTTGDRHIDVLVFLFGSRIVTTLVDSPQEYDRYWCYGSLTAAVLAANAWDGMPDTEPVGWIKAHGDRRPVTVS